jgi:hypothetical protein
MVSRERSLLDSIIVAVCVFFAGAVIALLQMAPEAHADVYAQGKEVIETVNKVAPTVEEIAKKLWDLSEVSLLEVKSSAYLEVDHENFFLHYFYRVAARSPSVFCKHGWG